MSFTLRSVVNSRRSSKICQTSRQGGQKIWWIKAVGRCSNQAQQIIKSIELDGVVIPSQLHLVRANKEVKLELVNWQLGQSIIKVACMQNQSEMCGKQDLTGLPPKNKRTHFYFHKSDESSDSTDDNGELSWSGEKLNHMADVNVHLYFSAIIA